MQKSAKKHNSSSSSAAPPHATSSTSAETPNSHGDADGPDVMAEMTAEEAMDLGEDSGGDDDGEDEDQANQSPDTSPAHDALAYDDDTKDTAMEIWAETHTGGPVNGWDRDRGTTGSALSVGS
jgi:hypothetical protein